MKILQSREFERKVEKFFLNYGKTFTGIVLGQFFFIILALLIMG